MRKFVVVLSALLLSRVALAQNQNDPVTESGYTESEMLKIDEMATSNPDQYELFRKSMVAQAVQENDYTMFLAWATADEIDKDSGVDPDEATLEQAKASRPRFLVTVHLGSQRIDIPSLGIHGKKVATGKSGFRTHIGCEVPTRKKERIHPSRQFHNFPLPNFIAFYGGQAFHIGNVEHQSHGCIHLDPDTSRRLYNAYQPGNMQVCVQR